MCAAAVLLACSQAADAATLPPIHHVYTIVLENESASTTFGPGSPAPYLSKTLRAQGAYIPGYFGIGHASLDNYIAMVSGQAPNALTQADCLVYNDLFPGTIVGAYQQASGVGCVYPGTVQTVANQLDAAGETWRDYNDGMGADPTRETAVCGHPTVNSRDGTQSATAKDQYATRHNPFVYFHSIIDDTVLCNSHVVGLDPLAQDLATVDAPNYVFITPSLCNDAHDSKCPNGGLGGLEAADAFLRTWVPRIVASPSFQRDGGLLMILFDEASSDDSRKCCGQIAGPGNPLATSGGGNTGAILLSPYIRPGTVTQAQYNHYGMLRSVEDIFSLQHLGYAQLPGVTSFGSDVFTCTPPPLARAVRRRLAGGSLVQAVRVTRGHGRVRLSLRSVRISKLRVVVTRAHRRPTVITRWLSPCSSYSLRLPSGHGRVKLTASVSTGSQVVARAY
jgi:hypothetical protein